MTPQLGRAPAARRGAPRAAIAVFFAAAALGACNGTTPGKAPRPAATAPTKARWEPGRARFPASEEPRRPSTEAESLRIADLPIFLEHPLPIEPAGQQLPSGPVAPEVEVTPYQPIFTQDVSARTVSVKLVAPGFGQFRGFDARYTYYDCNSQLEPSRFQLRWETLVTQPPSAVEFAVIDGWLEKSSCSVHVHRRTTVRPLEAARGLILAFRACREACDEQRVVTFLTPALDALARDGIGGEVKTEIDQYTRITVNVRRGQAVSLLARVSPAAAAAWLGEDRLAALPHPDIVVGIDVAQVVGDAEPTVLAYLQ